ncbi:hypothetical protein Drorol1_Dr00001480 [Drosera rotundifolia]
MDSNGAILEKDDSHVNEVISPRYNDLNRRVKFLCSFSGSILPRPQDGKLRYVGGETRIVSVPPDICYDDLMTRMRELYEDAAILKYQQPDEDLDALVSVVNDEDVMNMMEEYDKLGSADGFTRLRFFLFSQPEQDFSPHFIDYMDGDGRDNERRYVDALNSLNGSPEYRRQLYEYDGSPPRPMLDEFHVDQFNSMNLEGGVYSHRNFDIPIPQYNLRPLVVPNLASGHQSMAVTQRYHEETSWSPAYYSPRYTGINDPRAVPELLSSPSSARHHISYGEVPDNGADRAPEEFYRPESNYQPQYDLQAQYSDNFVGLPPDNGGFPGNILQRPSGFDGNIICEGCRMIFQRNHSARESNWRHEEQLHMEHSRVANGFPPIESSCIDCLRNQEVPSANADLTLQHWGYSEQIDARSDYGETQAFERRRVLHHEGNSRADQPGVHMSGAGRVNDHYVVDGSRTGFHHVHGHLSDGLHMPPSRLHHDDLQYVQSGHESGKEFLGQAVAPGSHIHIPYEERGARHANLPYRYVADTSYQHSHTNLPAHVSWKNIPPPVHVHSTGDLSNLLQRHATDFPELQTSTVKYSPRSSSGMEHYPYAESFRGRMGSGQTTLPDNTESDALNQHDGALSEGRVNILSQNSNQKQSQSSNNASLESLLDSIRMPDAFPMLVNEKSVCSSTSGNVSGARVETGENNSGAKVDTGGNGSGARVYAESNDSEQRADTGKSISGQRGGTGGNISSLLGDWSTDLRQLESSDWKNIHDELTSGSSNAGSVTKSIGLHSPNGTSSAEECGAADLDGDADTAVADNTNLSLLPELVASEKQTKLETVEMVKVEALKEAYAYKAVNSSSNNSDAGERDAENVDGSSKCVSDNENITDSKIEPTTAEEEAIARGLQTIRNEDLEEIRELGSGTYGSVYHGKWRGSDVAIKRIKASCFAGRPSERERLIADFWKEALILSSVHHPNVVSFYGVVRDGPDGSLATVTEFMVNGSLKQYLRKKDRTIDRRKRLILAMDAAFGMEYLHEKNIVHFDLKCENLLVNMRDPHRPICKIGDLGLSKVKQRTLVSGGVRGTLPWMAPELLSGKNNMVTEKIDVYSFGIVMWELLTGDEPYGDMNTAYIIGGIVNNSLRPQVPTWCDPEWKSLMESCWSADPAERPSFSEISQRLRNMAAAMNLK